MDDDVHRAWLLLKKGQPAEALNLLEPCCAADAASARAWFLLGVSQHLLGQVTQALDAFQQAVLLDPGNVQAHSAKANMLAILGRRQDALAGYRHALQLDPRNAAILANIALVLEALGRLEEALGYYDQALLIDPNLLEALLNRGAVLTKLNRLEEALENNRRLTQCHPDLADAHFNLAEVLLSLRRFAEAKAACERAIASDSKHAKSHIDLGLALAALGHIEQAERSFQEASRIDPTSLASFENPLREEAHRDPGGFDPRLIYLHMAYERQELCDWRVRDAYIDRFQRFIGESLGRPDEIRDRALLFESFSLPLKPEIRFSLARSVAKVVSAKALQAPALWVISRRASTGRLKIGYISPDFRDHPGGQLTRRLYELHDRNDFEVYCYSLRAGDGSAVHRHIRRTCDHFEDLYAVGDEEAAFRIHRDGIRILIDLAGYTSHARTEILARRPAPLQVNYLGYHGTLGGDFTDYHITDPVASPTGQDALWTERLVYLPDTFFLYDNRKPVGPIRLRRDDVGLPPKGFVFCCFNKSVKIEPVVFDIWMRLLEAVPGSVLWLLSDEQDTEENLQREAVMRGIDARRLVFAPRVGSETHLARQCLADLFLDTLWFNAHSTACDALWSGLPLLTCAGDDIYSRIGASLLNALQLPELITDTIEEYESRALHLATHPDKLKAIRRKLAENRTSGRLFNTEQRVRELETAYRMMWERHEAGQAPAAFHVPK